jgi:hypothetical protein
MMERFDQVTWRTNGFVRFEAERVGSAVNLCGLVVGGMVLPIGPVVRLQLRKCPQGGT